MPAPFDNETLDYYATPGPLTSLGRHADAFSHVGGDPARAAAAVQNVLVHRAWAPLYQFEVTPERQREEGLRGAEAMLDRVLALDARPLSEPREPAQRMVSNCRHFSVLFVALLRHAGVPARARCGFSSYFERAKHLDHWVGEYWHAGESRWVMVDAQLDARQVSLIKPDFDPLDVPRNRFRVAGDAWQRCRAGESDPARYGIADMWGLGYISGNVFCDIAALNKIEPLPWDVWYADQPGQPLTAERTAFIDRIAPSSAAAHEAAAPDVRSLYASEQRLQVPDDWLKRFEEEDRAGNTAPNPLALKTEN